MKQQEKTRITQERILDAGWYQVAEHILECSVGLMIGTELVWPPHLLLPFPSCGNSRQTDR